MWVHYTNIGISSRLFTLKMNSYEAQRLENIRRNKALVNGLGIKREERPATPTFGANQFSKKRKLNDSIVPTRTSSRIASKPQRTSYDDDRASEPSVSLAASKKPTSKASQKSRKTPRSLSQEAPPPSTKLPSKAIESIKVGWSSWTLSAGLPSREPVTGTFHFESHPLFTPNKSPEEMLREGSFGGSYFRPLYSKRLGITVADDWRELPTSWIEGLSVHKYLTDPKYDSSVNKYGVSCGQSIEQWEENGWINHNHDVRGWFQWYCRFFMGRRCEDDDRQVSRWAKCVGESGRWRRALLRKFIATGVRTVWDDGEDDDTPEVSPVIHQTCHHWAFEVRQDVLDEFWRSPK
ncbi:MAG: hypothetical protein M1831_002414 [Alyxoria varia]|nr:MAG: hypothetical protein M1831_002414 [Alyxoria varia]